MSKLTSDFLSVHNDDLILIGFYGDVPIYNINYKSALERENKFLRSLIEKRKKEEHDSKNESKKDKTSN